MNDFILLNPDDYREKSPTQRSLEILHELLEAETNPERRAEIQDDLHWLAGCDGHPQPLEVDEVDFEEVVKEIQRGPVEIPRGWYSWPHHTWLAFTPYSIYLGLREEWRLFWEFCERQPRVLDERMQREVKRHAWQVGRLGHLGLIERSWPWLTRQERGLALAGVAEVPQVFERGLTGDGLTPAILEKRAWQSWILARLDDAELSTDALLELLCCAVWCECVPLLARLLEKGRDQLHENAQRQALMHRMDLTEAAPREPSFEGESDRVVDRLLEASLQRAWLPGVREAVARGADVNLSFMCVTRWSTVVRTSLGVAIMQMRSGRIRDRAQEVFHFLVSSPDLETGVRHSAALEAAIQYREEACVRKMITRGVILVPEP